MKLENDNLTPEQSISIITAMIHEAKGKVQQNAIFFLLWGWVVALANLGMFILMQLNYDKFFVVWAITIPAWILSIYWGFRRRKPAGSVMTHFDRINGMLWICFGVVIFTLIGFGAKINYQLSPVILLVSALPTFVSGMILRFRPLMLGGAFFWICSMVSFLLPMIYQPLAGAIAVAFGYLLPAYLLKTKSN